MKKLLILTVAMALIGAQAGYSATTTKTTTPVKPVPVAVKKAEVKPAVAVKPAPVAAKAEVKPAVAAKPAAVEVKKAEAPAVEVKTAETTVKTEPQKAEKCSCKLCKKDKPCFFCKLFKKCK